MSSACDLRWADDPARHVFEDDLGLGLCFWCGLRAGAHSAVTRTHAVKATRTRMSVGDAVALGVEYAKRKEKRR